MAGLSLQWRMVHDSPIMLYSAYLIDHLGYVPYRDFFDVNMVGGYAINVLVGRVFGYGDLGFRCADLLWLSAILLVCWRTTREFGWQVAWSAVLIFELAYFHAGPAQSMQRDYLLVLPLAGAVLVATASPRARVGVSVFLVGLLIGIAATIKLQAAAAFPFVLGYTLWDAGSCGAHRAQLMRAGVAAALGLSLPVFAVFGYLSWSGGLFPFLDVIVNYLPTRLVRRARLEYSS